MYRRWSRVDEDNYFPMKGVRCPPDKISQLTTFGPWKRFKSTLNQHGCSLTARKSPLRSSEHTAHILVSHNVIPQAVMTVFLFRDVCFFQKHQIVVVHSEVGSWGLGLPAPQWQWRHVELVSAMADRVIEADWYYGPLSYSESWGPIPQKYVVSPTVDPTGTHGPSRRKKLEKM